MYAIERIEPFKGKHFRVTRDGSSVALCATFASAMRKRERLMEADAVAAMTCTRCGQASITRATPNVCGRCRALEREPQGQCGCSSRRRTRCPVSSVSERPTSTHHETKGTTMQTMSTLSEFIAANDLSMTAAWTDANPNMPADDWARIASHYLCTITSPLGTMEVPYSMGPAHTEAPTLEMVLDSLASDAASVMNTPDWLDWAAEMGFELGDIAQAKDARKSHEITVAQTERLREILGVQFETLIWDTDRL